MKQADSNKQDDQEIKSLLDDVYDYLFENSFNIDTNFIEAFPDAYVDRDKNQIILENDVQKLVLTLSRSE